MSTTPENSPPFLLLTKNVDNWEFIDDNINKMTHRYSNMTWLATNMHPQAKRRNCIPDTTEKGVSKIELTTKWCKTEISLPSQVEKSWWSMYWIPSVPMTNPIKLAIVIMNMLNTAPIAQTCLYHGLSPNWGAMSVRRHRVESISGDHTLDAGSKKLASISGKINRLISHPHAKSLKERSCQSATKENTRSVVKMTFFEPPRGI